MTLKIEDLQQQARGAMYVAPERICVTADNELCGEDDPRAIRLLVAKGGEITASEAAAYGLIIAAPTADEPEAAAPSAEAPADEAPAAEEPIEEPKRAKKK